MDAPTAGNALVPDRSNIPGWGVDADPENDPTYPYRERDKDDHSGEWARPPVQHSDVEILQSIEHKRRPAVFGTSTPPSGVSGMLRRGAFRYSESHWAHWLMLMGADRVNMVEGIVQDLARAKIPNIPAEMGMRSEWKHNRKGLVTKVAVTAAVGVAAFALFKWSGSRSERHEADDRD
ncbi:MAG TPA: hypothetical protein VF548_11560 [Allosphingosinicella sp.]|jgi:hypothetical protein